MSFVNLKEFECSHRQCDSDWYDLWHNYKCSQSYHVHLTPLYLFQFSSIDLCTATTKPKFTQYSTTQLQMTVSLLILDQFRQSWAHFKAVTKLYKWLPSNIIFSTIPKFTQYSTTQLEIHNNPVPLANSNGCIFVNIGLIYTILGSF